jgi:membrane protease YdiL (CAAX protease family)
VHAENQPAFPELYAGRPRPTPVGSVWHTLTLVVFLLAVAVLQYQPQLQAKSAIQLPHLVRVYIATIIYEWVLVGYVWFFGLRRRGVKLAEIVGGKWRTAVDFFIDAGIALGFWAVILMVLGLLAYLIHFSGEEAAQFLLPRTPVEMVVFVILAWCAGFCEEVIFRGYLQRQFFAWTGSLVSGIVLQALVFGSAHLYQGPKAVVVISVYGAMFGAMAALRKSLRPGMIQHAGQDTVSGLAGRFALKAAHHLHVLKF